MALTQREEITGGGSQQEQRVKHFMGADLSVGKKLWSHLKVLYIDNILNG